MSTIPFTRTLPYVLREQLQGEGPGLRPLVARVVSVPGPGEVVISVVGQNLTVPRLATYTPNPGEVAYCMASDSAIVAIGTIGTAAGVGNADTLDGLDSTAFVKTADEFVYLRQVFAGQHKCWWSRFGPVTTDATNGYTVHAHSLAAVPALVLATTRILSAARIERADADASNATVYWINAAGNPAISVGSCFGFLFLIA